MSAQNPKEYYFILRKSYLFSAIAEKDLMFIAKFVKWASLPAHTILCKEHTEGDTCFFVVSGRVKLLTARDDKNTIVRILTTGDTIGESILLTGGKYPVTAQTETPVDILSLSRKEFEYILQVRPHLSFYFSRLLLRRISDIHAYHKTAVFMPEVFSVFSCVDIEHLCSFLARIVINLQEQTRKKILFVELFDQEPVIIPRLNIGIKSRTILLRDVVKKQNCQDYAISYGPGIDIISIKVRSSDASYIAALFHVFRNYYHFVAVYYPEQKSEMAQYIRKESNKVLFLFDDVSNTALQEWDMVSKELEPDGRTPFKIFLNTGTHKRPLNADCTISWSNGKQITSIQKNSRELPAKTQRSFQHCARRLGHVSIGIAMGAGSAFGFGIIGVLNVLEKHGIYPDYVAGTSMGSLISAYYLSGRSITDIETEAKRISKRWLWDHLDFAFPRSGFVYGNALEKYLKNYLGDITFQDLPIPFACVTTDIVTGLETIITEGHVYQAVRASVSIPIILEPYYFNGSYLVDGGLINPVPTNIVVRMGADIVIAVNLIIKVTERKLPPFIKPLDNKKATPAKKPNIAEVFLKTFYTMQYEIARQQAGSAQVVIAPSFKAHSWMDFHRSEYFIREGEKTTETVIPTIKSLMPYFNPQNRD